MAGMVSSLDRNGRASAVPRFALAVGVTDAHLGALTLTVQFFEPHVDHGKIVGRTGSDHISSPLSAG